MVDQHPQMADICRKPFSSAASAIKTRSIKRAKLHKNHTCEFSMCSVPNACVIASFGGYFSSGSCVRLWASCNKKESCAKLPTESTTEENPSNSDFNANPVLFNH